MGRTVPGRYSLASRPHGGGRGKTVLTSPEKPGAEPRHARPLLAAHRALGFSIECNKFAPPATKSHFLARTYLEGGAILAEARAPAPSMLAEMPGFVAAMGKTGPWTPVGIALAMSEPNGPVEHAFFVELLDTIQQRLTAALPVDAVYICAHGAAVTTDEDDPDGVLFATVRRIVGPAVLIAATLDLHANVSPVMVDAASCFADVADIADNPGGGSRGNTTFLLRAFHEAGVAEALFGLIYDRPLAVDAHRAGLGAGFAAHFNRAETAEFSEPWEAPATVVALSDGNCVGRRGIYAGTHLALGPCAALRVGGLTVVVASHRVQCADPVVFEMMGLDIASARAVAVKSRGHFRGGFDQFFGPGQIVEVDLPGLTSPMLHPFGWTRLPRPVIPLDEDVEWPAAIDDAR